jgi:hypothetical protein
MSPSEPEIAESVLSRIKGVEARLDRIEEFARADPIWNLRVIRIKRTSDVIAFVAFMLSAITLGAAIVQATNRAQVYSFYPRQVFLGENNRLSRPLRSKKPQVIFSVVSQYVNQTTDVSGMIQSESLIFTVTRPNKPETNYEYQDYQQVRSVPSTTNALEPPTLTYLGDPSAFVVSQQQPVTHEILYIPFLEPRCLSSDTACKDYQLSYDWEDFEADMRAFPPQSSMNVKFVIEAFLYGRPYWYYLWSKTYTISSSVCEISLDYGNRLDLINNKWLAPTCKRENS